MYIYIYMYVFDARDQQTGPSHALACPARSYVSVVSKKTREGEREGEKSMNNQSTLLFFLLFDIGSPASQQSNCILLLNIPCFFSFSLSRSPFCSLVDMTIGTKSRERENTHKYIEHDGEMMKEDEDE